MPMARRAAAEFVGTMFLVVAIVGAAFSATQLSPGTDWLPMLAMSLAAGATLGALILAMQSVSADFNPAVTLVGAALGAVNAVTAAVMVVAQFVGGFVGVVVANLMFSSHTLTTSTIERTGGKQWLGEIIATMGLVLVVFAVVRAGRSNLVAWAVGVYLTAAFWFTSSGAFANPAVTLSRGFTDSVSGIAPSNMAMFILAELVGGALAFAVIKLIYPQVRPAALEEVPGEPRQEPARTAAKKPRK